MAGDTVSSGKDPLHRSAASSVLDWINVTLAFWASLTLATAGTIIALGSIAYAEYRVNINPALDMVLGPGAQLNRLMSIFWVAVGLQILFLMAVALAAATRRVHAFRSTLWSAGAVTTALGVREAQEMYTSMPLMDKADPEAHGSFVAFMVGASLYISGNLLLAFSGDAMYRAKRVAGIGGFVTFRSTSFKASEQSKQGDEQAGEQDDAPVASKAGLVGWLFLASGALSLAGTFIALGGIGALQHHCSTNGILGFPNPIAPCNRRLSMRWVVWALQLCFLGVTGLCYALKQIHNYRVSLWSTAGMVTSLSTFITYYFVFDFTQGGKTAQPEPAWTAALIGFCFFVAGNFVMIVSGDYLYRLRHEEGADGFVSMRRPGPYAKPAQRVRAGIMPRRPAEWAFLLSVALALAGTIVALVALANAQANCSPESLPWFGRGKRCGQFLGYPWFAVALEIAVLAGTITAWVHSYVHSFKASLWSMGAVITFVCIVNANWVYLAWEYSTGAMHDSLVACLYGLAIMASANYLMMAAGDFLHQLRREEGADGFITFRRPAFPAQKLAASVDP